MTGQETYYRAALESKLRTLAREDLIEFACRTDPLAAPQYRAPHLQRIAEKLEAIERGEIKRLFVTCPPRHWKSSLCSEKFPTWFLARHPDKSVIAAAHTLALVEKFSRNVRDTILANLHFKELFPKLQIRHDAAGVSDWSLRYAWRSSFRAVGVGGALLGSGADLILIDDPIADAFEAMSKTQRDNLWQWYQTTLRTRLEPGGSIVLIMSRWHEDDLAGRLMAASRAEDGEKWETLHLPALDVAGEALWPERWPLAGLEQVKKAIGSRAFAAQFQGDPRHDEGAILDSSKLVMVEESELPKFSKVVRSWDLAFSDRQGADYVAGAKLGLAPNGDRYILHLKRLHGRWTASKPSIIDTAQEDGARVTCSIEANGTQLGYFQDIQADARMQRIEVLPDKPEGTKEMRASVWGSRLVDGIIKCVRAPWNAMLFDQMNYFPNTDHDDLVDAVSAAFAQLGESSGASESVAVDRKISLSSGRARFAI